MRNGGSRGGMRDASAHCSGPTYPNPKAPESHNTLRYNGGRGAKERGMKNGEWGEAGTT